MWLDGIGALFAIAESLCYRGGSASGEEPMKLTPLAVLLLSVGQGMVAQASECSAVSKSSDRLACYDRAAPPIAAKPVKPKLPVSPVAAPTSPPDQGQVVDMLAVENSKLDARLKTICRGC